MEGDGAGHGEAEDPALARLLGGGGEQHQGGRGGRIDGGGASEARGAGA